MEAPGAAADREAICRIRSPCVDNLFIEGGSVKLSGNDTRRPATNLELPSLGTISRRHSSRTVPRFKTNTQPPPRFDDLGTPCEGRAHSDRLFAAKRPAAATPEERLPMPAIFVAGDPSRDRPRRQRLPSLGIVPLQASRDLFRRPVAGQAAADRFIDFGAVHLTRDRPVATAPLGPPLRPGGVIVIPAAIAPQLAADRSGTAVDGPRDFQLIRSAVPQLRYAITFLNRKMTSPDYSWSETKGDWLVAPSRHRNSFHVVGNVPVPFYRADRVWSGKGTGTETMIAETTLRRLNFGSEPVPFPHVL